MNLLSCVFHCDGTRYDVLAGPMNCPPVNVGSGEGLTIRELAEMVAEAVGC